MAYSAIDKSSSLASTTLYTGNGTTAHAITGVGFQADFNWIKNRETTDVPNISDSVRGANYYLITSTTDDEQSGSENLQSWQSDGFTVGNDNQFNQSADGYVSWNWKAGTTTGLSGGTITPSAYSINTTSGFGIYKWSGTGTAGTIAHGLGVTPTMMIVKDLTSTGAWQVYHQDIGATKAIYLNEVDAAGVTSGPWNDTAPTTTTFALNNSDRTNGSSKDYIGYIFAPVKGFSCTGKYAGNALADGPAVYTGFKPSFILIKPINYAAAWTIVDNKRMGYNRENEVSVPNTNAAEGSGLQYVDFLSNGFKITSTAAEVNQSYDYLYMAFGQPLVSSNNIAATAI